MPSSVSPARAESVRAGGAAFVAIKVVRPLGPVVSAAGRRRQEGEHPQ